MLHEKLWTKLSKVKKKNPKLKFGEWIIGCQEYIAINRIQNKSFCLHNICVYTVYIYYVYINTNTCMYIFKKNMFILYIRYIYI